MREIALREIVALRVSEIVLASACSLSRHSVVSHAGINSSIDLRHALFGWRCLDFASGLSGFAWRILVGLDGAGCGSCSVFVSGFMWVILVSLVWYLVAEAAQEHGEGAYTVRWGELYREQDKVGIRLLLWDLLLLWLLAHDCRRGFVGVAYLIQSR